MAQASASPRARFWLYAPIVFVALLAAVWTGFWFYAAHRADQVVAAWIDREARAGRVHRCENRTVGGYPFRIEMRCSAPQVQIGGAGQPIVVRAASMLAVAQIYRPDLVIAEIAGPASIVAGGTSYAADWRTLRASIRGFPFTFARVSVVAEDPKIQQADAAQGPPLAAARHLELHARQRREAAGVGMAFDLAATTAAATASIPSSIAGRSFDVQAEAVLRGVKDLSPRPLIDRLRQWQANGGRLEVSRARVAQGDVIVVAKGEIGLTAEARLDGGLNMTVAGLDQIGGLLFGENDKARSQANLLGGLAMLAGRTDLEGKRAVTLPLRFKNGAVYLGPLPVGQTPPVF